MLVVVGGGCYGSYHARQVLKAMRVGRLPAQRLVVVDRDARCAAAAEFGGAPSEVAVTAEDWQDFLRRWLASDASPDDHVVPAPMTPHLLWNWLAAELGAAPEPPPDGLRPPYEQPGPSREPDTSATGVAWP